MSRRIRPLLWLLLAALIVVGLLRLRFDIEVLNLLPPGIPAVKGLKIYQQHFANARELIITVQAPETESAEEAARTIAERLRTATNLVSEVTWQPPWLEHPGQSAELIAYLWFNQPPEVFARLTNRFSPSVAAQTLAAAREQLATSMSPGDIARLGYDPFALTQLPSNATGAAPSFGEGEQLFSSADGKFRIIFVKAAGVPTSYRESVKWMTEIRSIVASAEAENHLGSEIRIGFTGGPAFVTEISTGMEGDLRKSVGSTMLIIVILFLWAHRRIKPLLWLLTLLALVLGGTLAIGGLLFGTVNVVSVGFAAILLGLAVDYGLVLYQEALHAPGTSSQEIRRALASSIIWSAVTTAGAFVILNFGGLPGLAQLGSLVAIGIALAAFVMLNFFLPPLLKGSKAAAASAPATPQPSGKKRNAVGWIATGSILVIALAILSQKRPALDHTTNSLRPKHSPAYDAMEQIKAQIARKQEPDWLLISGTNETEVVQKLAAVEPVLNQAVAEKQIESFTLPTSLLPRTDFQSANRDTARALAALAPAASEMARSNGFTPNSMAFTEEVLKTWRRAAQVTATFWPTNEMSLWIFEKVTARDAKNLYALGLVYASTNTAASQGWAAELPHDGVALAGWQRLGSDLLDVVQADFWRVMLPMLAILLVSLWLAFKRVAEMLLSLATLLFSGLCLWALMAVAGWSWNLLNLLAIPLLIGSGVDYSIHMQLALRRHGGDLRTTRKTVGRALLLCAATTVAGFGSNAFSSNAGLESLGLVCAAGIAFSFLTAFFLLPVWWKTVLGAKYQVSGEKTPELSAPSSLYRTEFWRMGLWIVRFIPRSFCIALGKFLVKLYWNLAPNRREILIQNLLPALNGERQAATDKAKTLLQNFAIKVVDLWQYEAGLPVERLLGTPSGWEHYAAAQATGRGILLLTPHLGNWEFGGPWMTRRNVKLLVITLAEPGKRLTELRQKSRARWNIETVVIGNDPFAFIEIMKRLEAGATVALLVDRPPAPTAIEVELFGKPFSASVAAAELARASGCVLLPVYMPHRDNAYDAHILPPINYDRAALRDRANRQKLTQEIMRAFEPAIKQHLDQWYHFIPIWRRL